MKECFILEDYLVDERNDKLNNFIQTLPAENRNIMEFIFDIIKMYKMDSNSYYACAYFVGLAKEKTDYNQIKNDYGREVAQILKKLNDVGFQTSKEADLEYVRHMFVCMVKDIRVLFILLAYNLYRTENIDKLPIDEQPIFARTVRDIYAPLSSRLGLRNIKNKMEDFSFKYFDPEMYEQLSHDDRLNKKERLQQIQNTIEQIKVGLEELKIEGEVYGREKHLASVYQKLKEKKTTLSQIYDLMAVRVIVNTVEECYLVLGKINSMFTIIPDRFKDYIATPKINGYKSIHTAILSTNNRPIEVQIRTKDMHHYNEYGIAAHWIYKDKSHKKSSMDTDINWLKEIIDENKDLSNKDFIETLSRDMFKDEIFAQTPNGKIMKFPAGANCIDFAYAVHSDIGNRCVGAKINGKMVPILTELNNGDVCEIILGNANKGPSRDWLNVVKTAGARSKINAYYKKQFVEENIKTGKNIFDLSAKSLGYDINTILESPKLKDVLNQYNLESIDELYSLIGNSNLKAESIINKLVARPKVNAEIKIATIKNKKKEKNAIIVGQMHDMMTRIAKCCLPIAGDDVIGFISYGRGVTIHRTDCVNVKYLDKSRLVDVKWDRTSPDDYQVRFKISFDGEASFAKIAEVLEKMNIKIVSFNISGANAKELNLIVIIKNRTDIDRVLTNINSINGIERCVRA